MIARLISKKKGGKDSAKSLIKYITSKIDATVIGLHSLSETDDIVDYTDEVLSVQQMNERSKTDKNIHLLLSFHKSDDLSNGNLKMIENEIIESLQLSEHQRISVLHNDTDHPHLHIAINSIHPSSFNKARLSHSKRILNHKVIEITQKFKLKPDFQISDNVIKKNKPIGAQDIESHQGEVSLFSQASNLKKQMETKKTWLELNKFLAENGLEILPKNKGYIIRRYDNVQMKASRIKGFGKTTLDKRLGAYKQNTNELKSIIPTMESATNQELSNKYWRNYQAYRDEKKNENIKIIENIKHKKAEIFNESKKEYQRIKSLPESVPKRGLHSVNKLNRVMKLEAVKQQYKSKNVIKGYADWLVDKALNDNDINAHLLLINRKDRVNERYDNSIMTASKHEEKELIKFIDKINYKIKTNGDVIYSSGSVKMIDRHKDININTIKNEEMNKLFFNFAVQKFGKELTLYGTEEFKRSMVKAAIDTNNSVQFNDDFSRKIYEASQLHKVEKIKSDIYKNYTKNHNMDSVERFINERKRHGEQVELFTIKSASKQFSIKAIRKTKEGQYLFMLSDNQNKLIVYPVQQKIAMQARREKQSALSLDKKLTCEFKLRKRKIKR